MFKKISALLALILLLASSLSPLMGLGLIEPVSAVGDNLDVKFELTKEGVTYVEFRVWVVNNASTAQQVPIDIILEPYQENPLVDVEIEDVQVWVWENKPDNITVNDYGEVTYNKTFFAILEDNGTLFAADGVDSNDNLINATIFESGSWIKWDNVTNTIWYNVTEIIGSHPEERWHHIREDFKNWYFQEQINSEYKKTTVTIPNATENQGFGYGTKVFDVRINTGLNQRSDGSWGSAGLMIWNVNGTFWQDDTNSSWWDNSWGKKAPLQINNTGCATALEYHQVYVNLTYDSDMNSDFSDIRIVNDTAEAEVPLWNMTVVDGAYAEFYFNVTSIPASSWLNNTYYIYYNNSEATSASDKDATFPFIDEFEIDLTKWTVTSDGTYPELSTDYAYGGAQSVKFPGASVAKLEKIYGSAQTGKVSIRIRDDATDTDAVTYFKVWSGATQLQIDIATTISVTNYVYYDNSDFHITSVVRTTGWHLFEYVVDASGFKVIIDGVEYSGNAITSFDKIEIRGHPNAYPVIHYYDNVMVRKYASPEPDVVVGAEEVPPVAEFIPPTPTSLANTTGNFYVNHTWDAGAENVTDSYNVSINSTWHNGTTNTFYNNTPLSAHDWSNISVYAYNSSGSGTLNTTGVSDNVQIPNNPITITNTSDAAVLETQNVYVDYDATDSDSDTPTFSCNRTDLFTDFSTSTGIGNWLTTITSSGVYSVDFGVSDGYGSTSNYTMTITVVDATPTAPTNIANTTGNFYVNHTWDSGLNTDTFNVSVNDTWTNGSTNLYYNNTPMSAHDWSNISVYAYNSTSGELSSAISQNTQIPNNPPSWTTIPTWSFNEDTTNSTLDLDDYCTDADGDSLTFTIIQEDATNITSSVNATNVVTFTPNADWNGDATFQYRVDDGQTTVDSATHTVQVVSVNDPPTGSLSADSYSYYVGQAGKFTATFTDIDGDTLTYRFWVSADNEWFNWGSTSTFVYTFYTPGDNTILVNVSDGTDYTEDSVSVYVSKEIIQTHPMPTPTISPTPIPDVVKVTSLEQFFDYICDIDANWFFDPLPIDWRYVDIFFNPFKFGGESS